MKNPFKRKVRILKVDELKDAAKIARCGYSFIIHYSNGKVGYSGINPLTKVSQEKQPKEPHKEYRIDINMYESRKLFLGFIPYYEYSIWRNGKVQTKYRLFKIRKDGASYFTFNSLPIPKVGLAEFKSVYNSNKWLIPVNYELDLSKP